MLLLLVCLLIVSTELWSNDQTLHTVTACAPYTTLRLVTVLASTTI